MMMTFSETEAEALEAGGALAGAYLDEIGKFDLSKLSESEWSRFLGHVLTGYSESMREQASAAPPF